MWVNFEESLFGANRDPALGPKEVAQIVFEFGEWLKTINADEKFSLFLLLESLQGDPETGKGSLPLRDCLILSIRGRCHHFRTNNLNLQE